MKLNRLEKSEVPWDDLDGFDDRNIFQSREWVEFLASTQQAEPVWAELNQDGRVAGYFTGLIVKRMGIRILGSPFVGWTTNYMGFNLLPGVSRADCLDAVKPFAFHDLRCLHLEVSDRHLSRQQGIAHGFRPQDDDWWDLDLTRSEDEIFNAMTRTCKGNIRRAERDGVVVEEANDMEFAEEFYQQLQGVFERQYLVPTYKLRRVQELMHHLLPTGRLLLLRARDSAGTCIATGVWLGMNKLAIFWGNASLKDYQRLRPNEALHWYAIRYWKKRGMQVLDWGGGAYKSKYGVTPCLHSQFIKSRFGVLQALRSGAQRAYAWRQRTIGHMQRRTDPT